MFKRFFNSRAAQVQSVVFTHASLTLFFGTWFAYAF